MAQASYISDGLSDAERAVKQKVSQIKASGEAAAQTRANRAVVGTATQAEFDAAREALKSKTPRAPAASPQPIARSAAVPATVRPTVLSANELTPAERASFANQTKTPLPQPRPMSVERAAFEASRQPVAAATQPVAQVAPKAGALAKANTLLKSPFAKGAQSGPAALALGGISAALDSANDIDSGYREEFNKQLVNEDLISKLPESTRGVASTVANTLADTVRVVGDFGNSVALGLPSNIGQGLSSMSQGQSFGSGFFGDVELPED